MSNVGISCPTCGQPASAIWVPYCSNQCEQRAQVLAARERPVQMELVQAVQLDLESARGWEPHRFALGTLEQYLSTVFERHPGERYPRGDLLSMARSAGIGRVNTRNVMDAIRELRRGGWPIISSSGEEGYWLSWEPADLDMLEQTLRGRSLDMLRTLSAVRRARTRSGWVPLDDMIKHLEEGEL